MFMLTLGSRSPGICTGCVALIRLAGPCGCDGHLISNTLATLGMVALTSDLALSLYVVLATVLVISGPLFFMIVICGWLVGPIEVEYVRLPTV